jgi:hypothetical protein
MTAPVDRLLDRLERVKRTGPGRWLALCPAHDDKNPSLTIRETDDGTVLVKCWTGCGAADVVAAAGLELRDLFPEKPPEARGPLRPRERWVPRDVLAALAHEVRFAAICASDLAKGQTLTPDDVLRLHVVVRRLDAAAREVGG